MIADRYAISSGSRRTEVFDLADRTSLLHLERPYSHPVPLGEGLLALKWFGQDRTDIIDLPSGEIRARLEGEWPHATTPQSGLVTWSPQRGLAWFSTDGNCRARIPGVLGVPLAVSPDGLLATSEEDRICVRHLGAQDVLAAWDCRPRDPHLLLFLGRRLFVGLDSGPLLVLDVAGH